MKKAVHFGAGNIGRGFIGEILSKNGFDIHFVDTNKSIIDELNNRHSYEIGIASSEHEKISVKAVSGINNSENPEAVIEAIAKADILTTAIGPNVLPYIAELIAKGLQKRKEEKVQSPLDIIACENMIGALNFWKKKCPIICRNLINFIFLNLLVFLMLQLTVLFLLKNIKMFSMLR